MVWNANLIGRKHNQLSPDGREPFLFVVREHLVPGRKKGVKIANRSTWCENGIAAVPAYELAHFLQNDVLHENEYGSDLVGEHIRVCCRS